MEKPNTLVTLDRIDELVKLEKYIKEGNYPTLVILMEKTNRSKNTVLKYIRTINDRFSSFYTEYEGKEMIKNSKLDGKKGYYYDNPSYSIKDVIDSEGKLQRDLLKEKLIKLLKTKVTSPGIMRLEKKYPNIANSIKNTEERLDKCKTLSDVIFFYEDAIIGLRGQEIAKTLRDNGLNCFEDLKEKVESYKKYL